MCFKILNLIYLKILILILFFLLSCQNSKQIENKYKISSNKIDRKSESDLSFPNSIFRPEKKIINSSISNLINNKTENNKEENLISNCIKDLNNGKYQVVIDKIILYIESKQRNKSKFHDENLGRSPLRDIYLILAIAYIESGDEIHAMSLINDLIYYADDWEPIYLTLCEIYLNKNAFFLTKRVALKGIDKLLNPSANIYIYYARSEINLNNIESAKKILKKIQILFPKNSEALALLGIIDLKSNNIIEACKKFKNAYMLNQSNAFLIYNYVACLIQSQDYKEAQDILQVGLLNSNFSLYYLGGVIASKQGKPLEAEKYWRNYIKRADANDLRQSYVRAVMPIINQSN